VNADVMYAATDSLHISMFDLENLVEGRAALFFNVEE